MDEIKELYHFCSMGSFYNIIKTKKFYMFELKKSNDPLEFSIELDKLYKEIIRLSKNDEYIVKRIDESKLTKENINNISAYGACFCLEDYVHMWRDYADNGKGVKLVFDYSKIKTYCNKKSYYNQIVEYEELENLYEKKAQFLLECLYDNPHFDFLCNFICAYDYLNIYKEKRYAAEKEFRIFKSFPKTHLNNGAKFMIVDGSIKEFIELDLLEMGLIRVEIGPNSINNEIDIKRFLYNYGLEKVIVNKSNLSMR